MHLNYLLVDHGEIVQVEIDKKEIVAALKREITKAAQDTITCDEPSLALYSGMMRKEQPGKYEVAGTSKDTELQDVWILSDIDDAIEERGEELMIAIEERMNEKLRGGRQLLQYFTDAAPAAVIHVMVKENKPHARKSKKQKLEPAVWNDELPPQFSLQEDYLYFANQEHAVKQHHDIHERAFTRVNSCTNGPREIPIADNVRGLSKSAFGANYVRLCRETYPEPRKEFDQELCASHTIRIRYCVEDLLTNYLDQIMNQLIQRALTDRFKIQPRVLSNVPAKTSAFLYELFLEAGPLFIVLDGIGKAFTKEDVSDFVCRDMFLSFCSKILKSWFGIKGLYFLVLGHVVGADTNSVPSGYTFSRLSLRLLRPAAIEQILKNTAAMNSGGKTIQAALGLDDEQTTQAAKHLFVQTCGHPRSLLEALRTIRTYQELMAYKDSTTNCFLDEQLRIHKSMIIDLLEAMHNGPEVNMATFMDDPCSKTQIILETLADRCDIHWEGELHKAKVYSPPMIRLVLQQFTLPLDKFMQQMASVEEVTIEYSTVLEWICLKRFQQLFRNKRTAESSQHKRPDQIRVWFI